MAWHRAVGMILGATFGLTSQVAARGDEPQAPAPNSIAAIEAEYEREAIKLEKVRLDRLAKLAASKTGAEADRAYETYFRGVIANNLYAEAEATAQTAMKTPNASPQVAMLAHLVKIIAEANRGEYPKSLADLEAALKASKAGEKSTLPVAMKLTLLDAYVQKLVQGGQFDIARQALKALQAKVEDPAVKDLVARRLKQVELVGQPAPAIEGSDIDGKPYKLADSQGNVVLVIFWATWCTANAQEVAAFDEAYETYRAKGLRIVGVNVDALQEDGQSVEAMIPGIKRFLVERNVRWPNLIDRPGDRDIAKRYGVTDVPSNVLIGRDGKVVQLDLSRVNLTQVLAREIAR